MVSPEVCRVDFGGIHNRKRNIDVRFSHFLQLVKPRPATHLHKFHKATHVQLKYTRDTISSITRLTHKGPEINTKLSNTYSGSSIFLGRCTELYHSNIIARRHGHVFRMALHNEGDWRLETWRARRASCHVSIRQSPSCVMPFWTHAKCLLAFISYHPMWIKAKNTFIKTVYSPRFYGGPYLQAKHADVCSGVLFWTACTRRPHVLSLPSSSGCEKSDSWRQAWSVKTAKKVMNGTTMWSCDTELCTNGVEATKCWDNRWYSLITQILEERVKTIFQWNHFGGQVLYTNLGFRIIPLLGTFTMSFGTSCISIYRMSLCCVHEW